MIKGIDPDFFRIITKSHSISVVGKIFKGSVDTLNVIKVTDGRVTADRSQRVRRSMDCTLALNSWEDIPLDVISYRIQLFFGVYNSFKIVYVPAGVYRVDSMGRTNRGAINISGTSLESYVVDDVFDKTRSFAKGIPIIKTIQDLVKESIPDVTWETPAEVPAGIPAVVDRTLDVATTIDRDRWEAIELLATKINADVYCGPDGKFRIRSKPRLFTAPAVGVIKEGPDGVLMKMSARVSRDETYNAVLAMGQSATAGTAPQSHWAKDLNTASPTYWGGPFGKKTFVVESSQLTTKALCQSHAELMLERLKSEVRTLDFSAVPNAAIEPDDVFNIQLMDGSTEKHMIGQFNMPIGTGEWAAQTLAGRIADPLPVP